MRRMILLAAAAAASFATTAATAQPDFNRPPSFGTINLTAGFTPDPRVVAVTAGGRFDASSIGNNCVGSIANQPDVRVMYTAGTGLPLIFSVSSDADTTLAINGPDGTWYCNDDGPNGLNPSITFSDPASGRYDVYIGHYNAGRSIPARLYISEVGSQ